MAELRKRGGADQGACAVERAVAGGGHRKAAIIGIETESTLQRKTKFTPEEDAHIWRMRHDEHRPMSHIRTAIGKSTTQTIWTRYKEMLKEHIKMRPVIEKAVRAYIKAGKTTPDEAKTLEAMIKRGI